LKATYQLVLTRGIKCSDEACGYVSETQQIEANFSLYCQRPAPIKGVKPQLTGLLEDYAYEELEYTCEKCKHHGNSSREARIAEAPDYLIIHFKRALDGGGKDKTKIEYGHELNLTKYRYKPEMGTLRYDLKAVVSHQGGQAGHYEAMAFNRRDPETGQAVWKEYNDERVIPMHPTRALDPLGGLTPYLLFYARRSEPTPQSKADLRK
jgi:ubiquitin C-terminal hydrolase